MALRESGKGEKGNLADDYPSHKPANMAAGSARIVRYILFAFFVSTLLESFPSIADKSG